MVSLLTPERPVAAFPGTAHAAKSRLFYHHRVNAIGEIDRRYDYRLDLGMLMLLGILMIILAAPVAVWSFQPEGGDEVLGLTGEPARWLLRLGAAVLVVSGAGMVRSKLRSKEISCVVFTPTSIRIPGLGQDIPYKSIRSLSTSPGEGGQILTITHPAGFVGLASTRMKSPEEFEEMSALLAQRTNLPA